MDLQYLNAPLSDFLFCFTKCIPLVIRPQFSSLKMPFFFLRVCAHLWFSLWCCVCHSWFQKFWSLAFLPKIKLRFQCYSGVFWLLQLDVIIININTFYLRAPFWITTDQCDQKKNKKNTERDVCVLFLYAQACQTPCMTICLIRNKNIMTQLP